jgi:hypothetical protein
MADPNSSFSEYASTTIANYSQDMADNISDNIPLYAYLKKNNNVVKCAGGTQITEQLLYGDNATVKWYDGYELLDVTPSDSVTTASFDWKQMNGNIVFNGREVAINAGTEKRHDIIEARTQACEITMTNTLGAAMFAAGTGSSGKEIGGLQAMVPTAYNTGTYGGINRATTSNAWWRSQLFDASDNSITLSATEMLHGLNRAHLLVSRGLEAPDLVIMGATHFGFFEAQLQANQRFTEPGMGKAGFLAYKYKGADVIYDPNCTTTSTYMLNTKYIRLRPHSTRNFKVAEQKVPTQQDATIIPIYWMGNITCRNANMQVLLNT